MSFAKTVERVQRQMRYFRLPEKNWPFMVEFLKANIDKADVDTSDINFLVSLLKEADDLNGITYTVGVPGTIDYATIFKWWHTSHKKKTTASSSRVEDTQEELMDAIRTFKNAERILKDANPEENPVTSIPLRNDYRKASDELIEAKSNYLFLFSL